MAKKILKKAQKGASVEPAYKYRVDNPSLKLREDLKKAMLNNITNRANRTKMDSLFKNTPTIDPRTGKSIKKKGGSVKSKKK